MFTIGIYFAWSPTPVKATTTELFFSEYIEGSSNNKALEIYNDTGAPVNLATGNYSVQMFFNGSASAGLSIPLTGTVVNGDVYVLAQSTAAAAILAQADQTNGSGWYNGDDAVALLKNGTIIDVIGQIGFDPGTEWGTGLASTADNTLRRKSTVCAGDTNGSNVFDPSIEWDGFATDTFGGLGAHSATCGTNQAINSTCPSPLNTNEGTATSTSVSATDPDGTVTSAAITSTPVPGISLINFVPAASAGGTATATLDVANTTAAGNYSVVIQYSNNDSPTPQTATCTVVVNVTAVAPSPSPSPSPTPTPGSVVISQVYGGGGNAGATLKNDFIEIINHTNSPINLSGWSVQYASATLANWQVTSLSNVVLQPGQYHLVQEAAGAGGTVDLPTADSTGTIAMGATSGKIALVSNTTPLTGTCPAGGSIIDFVGYDGANCFEGAPTAALTNTTAAIRKNNGCQDTDNNSNDFVTGAPAPRNSSSPTNNCTALSGIGSANPFGVQAGSSSTLTVVVSPASDPTSTGITVTADLSLIGGSAAQPFSGVGNTFTFFATVAVGTTPGLKNLPVTITDAQLRTATTTIPIQVQQPHVVISQIYGGGGNGGATYTNDYVELYNPSGVTFDLTGWSLQYSSATGDSWDFTRQPIGGTIASGEYYLIALSSGGSDGAPLPVAPNISGDINMAGTAGKVALVSNFDALEGTCPLGDPDIVDFVGYGATANCAETANAPAPSNTTAILRLNNGATDTDNNQSDFAAGAPNPRRTAPIVELGPAVFSTDPRNNGFNAPRDANITVNFTEPVDVVGSWFNINCATTGLHNDATFAGANKTYLIVPNVNFLAGEQCTVTILKDQIHDQDTDDGGPNTDTLSANYVFTFTVSTGTAPPYPPDVHLTMGNPNGATADTNQPNNYLMEKPEYALSYNRDNGRPNWVSWHLADEWVGTLARVDTFRADPAVLPTWYRVLGTDFSGSGFDRGHMVPNADRDKETSIPINQATFLMTNMLAQSPDNNQGPWADFENYLRSLLPGNELYIVAGPAGSGGTGSNGFATTIANGHVLVPSSTWKVVLVIPKGNNDVSRVTAASRTIAIEIPNVQGIRNNQWETYITTVDAVENETGYDFFSNVPDAVENAIEAGTNGTNPPGTAGQSVTTAEDASLSITLDAASPGGPLTYTIVNSPTHGSLLGSNGSRDYSPDPNFNGTDSFSFKVNDGLQDSNISTVNITVTAVNDQPVANSQSASTNGNTPVGITLTGSDVETPAAGLTFNVTLGPAHGSLSGAAPNLIYTPTTNYSGPDSFTFTVTDTGDGAAAALTSSEATVSITVNDTIAPMITAPPNVNLGTGAGATSCSLLISDGTLGTATASDNSGSVSVSRSGGPAGNVFPVGTTIVTYTATDAANNSTSATQSVTVFDNTAPTLTAPAPSSATANGSGQAPIPNVLPQVVASDNCSAVTLQQSPTAGTLVGVGPHTITITGTDAAGNPASVTTTFTVNPNTSGLTFSLSVTPSTVKRGKVATLNASFNNATGSLQLVTFKIRYNSPCGNATIGNIGPIPIAAGAHGNTSLPFLVPKNACTGLYTLTLESYVGGVLVNSTTAQLTVTN
jgi:DNA/RNA endonuclease G (NUC1)